MEIAITNKIKPVNIVLVISGMYYNYRKWMQYEIDESVRLNKPIIAIKPFGNTIMPQEVVNVAKTSINWNTDSIVSAIRIYSI